MSKNSIEFSLLNSEQRDSWLNSGHWTLDADSRKLKANQAAGTVPGNKRVEGSKTQTVKTLDFTVEYTFQLEAYI